MKPTSATALKCIITSALSLAFFGLGLAIAMPGPTLPTLAYNIGVTIQDISFVIPARAIGYLVGSFASGFILEKVNQRFVMFICLLSTSVGLLLIPRMQLVILLAVVMSTIGLTMGVLDTGGNVMCLQVWGKKSEPYMQVLHFCFAFGATIGPLVAQPFIMEAGTVNTSLHASLNVSNSVSESNVKRFTGVTWAFVICSCITFLVSLLFLGLSFLKNKTVTSQSDTTANEGRVFRMKMICLLFFFFMIYVGMEVAFGLYIYTFAINYSTAWTKDLATTLNTVFWGTFAAGRFGCIFVTRCLRPNTILRCDLIGTLISVVLLICYPLFDQSASFLLWGAVSLYGLSIASIFPTGISWAEQYITVNGAAAGTLVVGGALGEMILPLLVGQFITKNPMTLMYFTGGCMFVTSALYVILQVVASSKGKRQQQVSTSSESGARHETVNLLEMNDIENASVQA